MKQLNFAIVGCGVIAFTHAKSLESLREKDCVLYGACDIIPEKADAFAAEHHVPHVYYDHHDVMADPAVDVVCVCVPSGTHGEICKAAAEAGKAIVCEKPMEITPERIDDVIRTVERTHAKMQCIFQRRMMPAAIAVRQAIRDGKFGRICLAGADLRYYRDQAYYDSAGWRGTWEQDGGGALMNQGVHGIDLILWMLGDEVTSLCGRADTLARRISVEDTAAAVLKMKQGGLDVYKRQLSICCLLPFLLVLSGSFSDQTSILTHGYQLIPETFSLEAYKTLFKIPGDLLRAYGVTIFVTVTGTFLGLFLTSMAAYVLASSTFRYRYQMSFFFYFTSIFGGGLVPWYIFNTKYLHFHNNIISLILPILINVTYLLILKSYMAGIPEALYESARLDGAGDFTIYLRIAMPLCKAGLATVGLFIALNYWNDWYDAMLFLDEGRSDLYPLQYYLNNILTKAQAISAAAARSGLPMSEVPSEPMKLAMTVVATGPIILLYPFLQKYFVKGVTIGAVKG